METKKTSGAYLEDKKGIMYLMGLVVALSLVYISLEWSSVDAKAEVTQVTKIDVPIDIELPNTQETKPPKPQEPIISPDILNPVDNVVPVENIDIFTPEDNEEGVNLMPQSLIIGTGEVPGSDEPLTNVEIFPRFDGDVNSYLAENIKYPQIAIEVGLQGRVICQFVVNRDGSIVDVEVVRGVDPCLDKEAVRVIKSMPKWKPGIQNGRPVRVRFYLPVNFKLM